MRWPGRGLALCCCRRVQPLPLQSALSCCLESPPAIRLLWLSTHPPSAPHLAAHRSTCPTCRGCVDLFAALGKAGLPSNTSQYAQAARNACTQVRAGRAQRWLGRLCGAPHAAAETCLLISQLHPPAAAAPQARRDASQCAAVFAIVAANPEAATRPAALCRKLGVCR